MAKDCSAILFDRKVRLAYMFDQSMFLFIMLLNQTIRETKSSMGSWLRFGSLGSENNNKMQNHG